MLPSLALESLIIKSNYHPYILPWKHTQTLSMFLQQYSSSVIGELLVLRAGVDFSDSEEDGVVEIVRPPSATATVKLLTSESPAHFPSLYCDSVNCSAEIKVLPFLVCGVFSYQNYICTYFKVRLFHKAFL